LKAKLDLEYEEQVGIKRNYQQDFESLLKVTSKIREYVTRISELLFHSLVISVKIDIKSCPTRYQDSMKGEKLKELQEKHALSVSQLQSCDIRKQEILDELNKSRDVKLNQDLLRRNIEDNLNYRRTIAEIDELTREIESLEDNILQIGGFSTFEVDNVKFTQERERLLSDV